MAGTTVTENSKLHADDELIKWHQHIFLRLLSVFYFLSEKKRKKCYCVCILDAS